MSTKSEVKSFIPFPPYNYRVYVIFTDDLVETADNLAKQGSLAKNHGIDETVGGFHVRMPNSNHCFVVFKKLANINDITHEAYHAVTTMFRWIGATHEEELFAYHLGYLVREIVKDQKKANTYLTNPEK